MKDKDVNLEAEADERNSGPASSVLIDPDENMILFDQHV